MKIDIEDYAVIRADAMVLCSLCYTYDRSIRTIAADYHATTEEIAAIVEGRPVPERPLAPLPVVATYVER